MKLRFSSIYIIIIVAAALLAAALLQAPGIARLYYPYRYREIIESYSNDYEVDPLLVAAIIRVESKFHPRALSDKGAVGLMQIMPSTAEWIAAQLEVKDFNDEMLYDPELNIKFGTWYLGSLAREFDGRLEVIIAAYNGGRGKVKGWLEDNTWSGGYEDRNMIPFPETRHFLYKVYNVYGKYGQLY